MQNVLLLAAVAAIFAFGWLLMGKLDRSLEENCHAQELQLSSGGNSLRLGFCDPTVADSMTDVLEQYSKLYPDASVHIFCGSEGELLKVFSAGKVDVIFLPENAVIPPHIQYNFKIVSLNYTPLMMKYGGLPIEPIANGYIIQKALWIGKAASIFTSCFMNCLENKFTTSAQAK